MGFCFTYGNNFAIFVAEGCEKTIGVPKNAAKINFKRRQGNMSPIDPHYEAKN